MVMGMKNIDIVDIKTAVQMGDLKVFIQNGFYMLENTRSGEVVRLNQYLDIKSLEVERKYNG